MSHDAISEKELRARVLSTNKALSSTLLLLQSQNRALSSAISRMESRLKKKRGQQNAELAATADSAGSR